MNRSIFFIRVFSVIFVAFLVYVVCASIVVSLRTTTLDLPVYPTFTATVTPAPQSTAPLMDAVESDALLAEARNKLENKEYGEAMELSMRAFIYELNRDEAHELYMLARAGYDRRERTTTIATAVGLSILQALFIIWLTRATILEHRKRQEIIQNGYLIFATISNIQSVTTHTRWWTKRRTGRLNIKATYRLDEEEVECKVVNSARDPEVFPDANAYRAGETILVLFYNKYPKLVISQDYMSNPANIKMAAVGIIFMIIVSVLNMALFLLRQGVI